MVNQEFLNYIKEGLIKGSSRETITNNLTQVGWRIEDIQEGFKQSNPEPPSSSAVATQPIGSNKFSSIIFKIKAILGLFGGKSSRLKLVFTVITIFILFIGLLIPVFTVYADVKMPLISHKFRRGIVVFTYHIPFLPKTSEQIILAAVDSNTKLTAYKPDVSLSINLTTADIVGMSLDLKASGPVSISKDDNISYDLSFSAAGNLLFTDLDISGKVRKIENDAYVKIDSFPASLLGFVGLGDKLQNSPEIKKNLDDLFSNWIVIATDKKFESEAKDNLDRSQESIVSQVRDNVQDFLLRSNILKETKKLKDEKIDGDSTYHLRLIPSKTLLRSLIKEYESYNKNNSKNFSSLELENNFVDSVKNLQIDVWFGKGDTVLRKTSIVAKFKLDGFNDLLAGAYKERSSSMLIPGLSSLANTTLSISTVLKISDINKTVSISKPSPTMNSDEFGAVLQDAFKTKAQKAADSRKKLFNTYFVSISNALQKYYLKNYIYPSILSELTAEYLSPTNKAIQNFGSITFQVNSSKSDFIAYTTIFDGVESYLYGITSAGNYPHKLTKYDIDPIVRPKQ